MTLYRATRNEPRVGVGNWTGDFMRGEEYESWEYVEGERCPRGMVPDYICDYLVSHGILVDARVSDGPADSPKLPVGPSRTPTVKPLVEAKGPSVSHEPRSANG
jgi:hypothetical protein